MYSLPFHELDEESDMAESVGDQESRSRHACESCRYVTRSSFYSLVLNVRVVEEKQDVRQRDQHVYFASATTSDAFIFQGIDRKR